MTENRKQQLFSIVERLPIQTLDEKLHYLSTACYFNSGTEHDDRCRPVALFHDLVEDGYIDLDTLAAQAKLNQLQIEAIDNLTRKKKEDYFDYIKRLKPDDIASRVKLADLTDNIRRCAHDLPIKLSLLERYVKAYKLLTV